MSAILTGSICLTDIPKDAIVKAKNGKKYLNLSIFVNDETSQYGTNVGIAVSQSQEQREAKENKVYLGNGKVVFVKDGIQLAQKDEPQQAASANDSPLPEEEDDLPF